MKAILTIFAMFAFNSAHAQFIDYGKIHFQSASAWITPTKVCRDGGMLFHKNKDSIGVEYCDNDDENCKTVYKTLAQPVNSTKQVCKKYEDGDCLGYGTRPYVQGTTTAKVYRDREDWSEGKMPVRTFKYTVDSCN